jgi:hypothetical protein
MASMFSTDQAHLRKYLTTLGVAMAAGTLSLAGLFLRLAQDLIVTQAKLGQLTPTARAALLQRQRYLAVGTAILPLFVAIGFFGGLALAAYGLVGWARRQRIADEREDIGLRRDRVELLQLSETENDAKLDQDTKEALAVAAVASPTDQVRQFSNVRSELATAENELVSKLSELLGSDRVDGPSIISTTANDERAVVDAIARLSRARVVFELKYATSVKNVVNRIGDGFQRLARAAQIANASGVFILLVPDDSTEEQIRRWSKEARAMTRMYRSDLYFFISRYSEFHSLSPKGFAARIGLNELVWRGAESIR